MVTFFPTWASLLQRFYLCMLSMGCDCTAVILQFWVPCFLYTSPWSLSFEPYWKNLSVCLCGILVLGYCILREFDWCEFMHFVKRCLMWIPFYKYNFELFHPCLGVRRCFISLLSFPFFLFDIFAFLARWWKHYNYKKLIAM